MRQDNTTKIQVFFFTKIHPLKTLVGVMQWM